MKKKIFTLAMLTALTLVLTGCFSKKETLSIDGTLPTNTQEDATEAGTPSNQPYEYINKDKGFSFTLPAQWTFQENVFNSLVMFFAPQKENDKIKENLGITAVTLTGDVDLKSYYELGKGILEGRTNGFKIEKEETINIGGEDALKIIFKGTEAEYKLEWEQIVLLRGKTAYTFTYTATQDTFNDFLATADNIISTFTIK